MSVATNNQTRAKGDTSIAGQTAMVTGGVGGIGLCCVKELLRCEAKVAICDCNEVTGKEILKDLQSEFGFDRVIFIKVDVTKPAELEEAFKQTIATFKGLDIVLCNAGVYNDIEWEREIAVNLTASINCSLLALQYMGRDKGGRGGILCYTASIAGLIQFATSPMYVATKHAIIGLCRSFGQPFHFNRTGVRFVAMCPGLTETPMVADPRSIIIDRAWGDQLDIDISTFPLQKPENVGVGMMTLIREATSGSIWISEGGQPVYEVVIPHYETLKKKK